MGVATADGKVTTSLVRPRERGDNPWWRTAVICDLPGLHTDDSLYLLGGFLPNLANVGFDALLLRPATPRVHDELQGLPELVARAHEVGLKVLIRGFRLPDGQVLPSLGDTPQLDAPEDIELVTARMRTALEAGVDGIDLGTISIPLDEDSGRAAAFSAAVQAALAQIAVGNESAILSAGLPAHPTEEFAHHLREDWFHHLRSSKMLEVGWDAEELRHAITQTYSDYDPLGLAVPWRHVLQQWTGSTKDRGSANMGWAKDAPAERYGAMNLYVASLPGSVYLPFLHTGGEVEFSKTDASAMYLDFAHGPVHRARAERTRNALLLRRKFGLASAPIAFVEGLPWTERGTLVHLAGEAMVVLNAGDTEVVVPPEHRLLTSSDNGAVRHAGGTHVPPNTCAWFRAGAPQPTDPANYRGAR